MTGPLAAGLALAYLSGSFPTAYLAGRASGVDLGAAGSGNYGATNVFRTLGAAPGIVVLALDAAKGYFPVLLIPGWLPSPGLPVDAHGVLLAAAAVLGHVFSIFVRFRGGKGVATAAGAFAALAPLATLGAALAWLAIAGVTRIASLASLTAAAVLLVGVVLLAATVKADDSWLVAATALLALFVVWTHRENIARLRRGEEHRILAGRGGRPRA